MEEVSMGTAKIVLRILGIIGLIVALFMYVAGCQTGMAGCMLGDAEKIRVASEYIEWIIPLVAFSLLSLIISFILR